MQFVFSLISNNRTLRHLFGLNVNIVEIGRSAIIYWNQQHSNFCWSDKIIFVPHILCTSALSNDLLGVGVAL